MSISRDLPVSLVLLLACTRTPPTPAPAPAPAPIPASSPQAAPDAAPDPGPMVPAENDTRCRARLAAMPPLPARDGGGPCTTLGCANGFSVDLQPDASWAAGAYTWEIDLDGHRITCEGALPLRPCGERSVQCTSHDVTISESGCALPAAQRAFSGLSFDQNLCPEHVHVTLKRGADVLFDQDFRPEYRRIVANGPGCGPVCINAHATVNVPRAARP